MALVRVPTESPQVQVRSVATPRFSTGKTVLSGTPRHDCYYGLISLGKPFMQDSLRLVGKSVVQVYTILLDEGRYLCSQATRTSMTSNTVVGCTRSRTSVVPLPAARVK